MKIKETAYRYERKFIAANKNLIEAVAIIKNNPSCFSEIYQSRHVNNIYFDTPDYTHYLDNISGQPDRKKIRIRWYGEIFGKTKSPVLEFKIKRGLVGKQLQFQLSPFSIDNNLNSNILSEVFSESGLPEWVLEDLEKHSPTLLNSYRRKYLLSFNKYFRITLDDQLLYTDIAKNNNTFSKQIKDDSAIIIELKYNEDKDSLASSVSNHFPFRLYKNSKYINGIELLKKK